MNFVFHVAKGKAGHYASLPGSNDALVVVPLAAVGMPADATLIAATSLTGVLALATEQTTLGRKTPTGVNTTMGTIFLGDFDNVVWPGASGAAIGALVVGYIPDVSSISDATTIPLTKQDFTATPNGGAITAQVLIGFYRVT